MQSATDITTSYLNGKTFTPANVTLKGTCTAAQITAANAASTDSLCKGATAPTGTATSTEVEKSISFAPNSTDFVVYSFADGTTFGYNKNAKRCSVKGAADCYGFIDVNGATGPNTVINCAKAAAAQGSTCESSEITDIYPVIFYGQTVEPASDSARAVLFGK